MLLLDDRRIAECGDCVVYAPGFLRGGMDEKKYGSVLLSAVIVGFLAAAVRDGFQRDDQARSIEREEAYVAKRDQEWRETLSPEQYRVLPGKGTESPGTGEYLHNNESGTYACAGGGDKLFDADAKDREKPTEEAVATFGGGCFWCIEAALERFNGVTNVASGYAGGDKADPTYEEVCSGTTGHAEVTQVYYDPSQLSYEALLDFFFRAHDPTTLNRQGADVGTQYRSIILYHNDEQKAKALQVIKQVEQSGMYQGEVVTEVVPLKKFYPAETHHQDYFDRNRAQPFCRMVIQPKLKKLGLE